MNWALWIQIAYEVAKNAPQLISDVEKLWHDLQSSTNEKPSAEHQAQFAAAVQQAKTAAAARHP